MGFFDEFLNDTVTDKADRDIMAGLAKKYPGIEQGGPSAAPRDKGRWPRVVGVARPDSDDAPKARGQAPRPRGQGRSFGKRKPPSR